MNMTKVKNPSSPSWFCVQTQSKREHIAAQWLKRHLEIEVFVPRIRFQRAEARGLIWSTEALFPNYLFAKFAPACLMQHVDCASGVRGVVRFGNQCPTVPDNVIEHLQASLGGEEVHVLDQQLQPGETVRLAGGAFHGVEAMVTRVMPARQRVTVLLEFLGRQTTLELNASALAPVTNQRLRAFRPSP
jgi:transcriptional antiterminator RfaH